jgi:hypothetical protein
VEWWVRISLNSNLEEQEYCLFVLFLIFDNKNRWKERTGCLGSNFKGVSIWVEGWVKTSFNRNLEEQEYCFLVYLLVCTLSITMYFNTQKINRVVMTPCSSAVYCIYIPSEWLIVKNTRNPSIIQYCIYICMYCITVGGADLYMGIYIYTYIYVYRS